MKRISDGIRNYLGSIFTSQNLNIHNISYIIGRSLSVIYYVNRHFNAVSYIVSKGIGCNFKCGISGNQIRSQLSTSGIFGNIVLNTHKADYQYSKEYRGIWVNLFKKFLGAIVIVVLFVLGVVFCHFGLVYFIGGETLRDKFLGFVCLVFMIFVACLII